MTIQTTTYPLRTAAKMIGVGPNELFKKLRAEKVLDANNVPYQRFIRGGLFAVHHGTWEHPETGTKHYARPEITDQGINWLKKRFSQEQKQ